MRKRLKEKLTTTMAPEALGRVYSAFDIIGDIAVIKTNQLSPEEAKVTAEKILKIHKNVKTVYTQISAIRSGYRDRELRLLAGDKKTIATHKESSCIFQVDIAKCYFSPRLLHERTRIAKLVQRGETVVNMFAGVGCFSVIIAKTTPEVKIYSIDVNPAAYKFMVENVRQNRVYTKVLPILGDAREVIGSRLQGVADRVLMPLPELALQYLPTALSALKPCGGSIHFHYFVHATSKEDPIQKTKTEVEATLDNLSINYSIAAGRIVRSTGPNWWHIVLDIKVNGSPSKF